MSDRELRRLEVLQDLDHREGDFVADSTLEESGFELLVPLVDAGLFGRTGRK